MLVLRVSEHKLKIENGADLIHTYKLNIQCIRSKVLLILYTQCLDLVYCDIV